MTEYLEWKEDGRPIVRVHRRVLAGLEREPSREFDGVLLGTASPADREVAVEDFAPLNAPDRHSLPVVGYFRVGRGGDLQIDEQERHAFDEHFPDPLQVFLLFDHAPEGMQWADVYVQPGVPVGSRRILLDEPEFQTPEAVAAVEDVAPPPDNFHRYLWPAAIAAAVAVILAAAYLTRPPHRPSETANVTRPKPPLADWKPVQKQPAAPPPVVTAPVTPVAAPKQSPFEADRSVDTSNRTEVQHQIRSVLERWRESLLKEDVGAYASLYAPSVGPYFRESSVSRPQIAEEVRRMLNRYGDLTSYKISNVSITPVDENHAVANFRKEWRTANDTFSGAERAELSFERQNGEWLIASEQEKEVYWVKRR
jgi:hypothetical protein